MVARLEDGSWSAPSAIGTGGMGFGGQIGAEITDFVVVLNNRTAVKSFATGGNVTLGGNLSGMFPHLLCSPYEFSPINTNIIILTSTMSVFSCCWTYWTNC